MKIPILRLEKILISSIQIELSDEDAMEFQLDILEAVRRTEAEGVLIDITGVEVVDSYLARILNETVDMVGLLGAKSAVCGMQPAVATTLVEMGREFVNVKTALNLDQGMAMLKHEIEKEL